mgnify:CR=1 FL=1
MRIEKDSKYYEILNNIRNEVLKNMSLNFTGSSPPEIFVGEFNYPNVYSGVLSPVKHDEYSYKLSSPEEWFKARLNEKDILLCRASMIYSRFISNVRLKNKLTDVMQEVSMAKKPVDVSFELKKKPKLSFKLDEFHRPIFNPAPLKKAVLEENPSVDKRVEYVSSDYDLRAKDGILDLYKHNLGITNINKLLSAGLLGVNVQRKLVPTKWAITCVDDIISGNLIKKIKDYQWINEYLVFHDEYLGNHYEILLMPRQFSFEVIEAKYNQNLSMVDFWQDYESHDKRKTYAASVTGAYYSNKLSIAEHLERIKRQASVLILREVRDYQMPCGVGVLREVTRSAMNKKPCVFNDLKSAVEDMKTRLKMPINMFLGKSDLLKEMREQVTLNRFL